MGLQKHMTLKRTKLLKQPNILIKHKNYANDVHFAVAEWNAVFFRAICAVIFAAQLCELWGLYLAAHVGIFHGKFACI